MTTQLATPTLYDQDYCLWLETTTQLLKNRAFEELDLENLIEEIEGMTRSQKNALESNLRVVLMHLLKWKYQPSKRSNSWKYSIAEHSIRINKDLKDSPSLKPYFKEVFDENYQDARKLASKETGLPLETFPIDSPFQPEDALNPDYLLE